MTIRAWQSCPGGLVTMVVAVSGFAVPLHGQRAAADSARISRMITGLRTYGYTRAVFVGQGTGPADAVFVFTATTRADSGVLLVAGESATAAPRPLVLERAHTPADLGVHGVEVASFLGARDLIDVEVSHQPFLLETSRTFNTHHVLRRQGEVLTAVCDLDGGASSSYSKGIGSNTTTREVTIAKVPGTALTFSVRTAAKTVQRRDGDAVPTVDTTTIMKWYELPPVGTCREVRAPRP